MRRNPIGCFSVLIAVICFCLSGGQIQAASETALIACPACDSKATGNDEVHTAQIHRSAALVGAVEPDTGRTTPAGDADEPYTVSIGDRLKISVYRYADLSQVYLVRADGTLSMPVVGAVRVAGMTLADIENDLQRRYSSLSTHTVSVNIEVASYAPVYVLGYVQKAGQYEWKPGLDVLQLVSLAGGYPQLTRKMQVDAARETGGIRETAEELAAGIARQERLRADIDGAEQVEVTEEMTRLVGKERAQALRDTEMQVLESRIRRRKAIDENAANVISFIRSEIQELRAQQEFIKKEMELRASVANKIEALLERGHSSAERLALLQSEVVRLQALTSEIIGKIRAAEERIAQTRERTERSHLDERLNAKTELATQEATNAKLLKRLATSRQIVAKLGELGCHLRAADSNLKPSFQIIRRVAGVAKSLDVSEVAAIKPGDTLQVIRSMSDCSDTE